MSLSKRLLKSAWFQGMVAALAASYVKFVLCSVRWSVRYPEKVQALRGAKSPFIVCFWHGRMLPMLAAIGKDDLPVHMLISGHSDGVLISRAVAYLGIATVKGSSHRGGATALREIQRVLKSTNIVGITPDGPRGPRMRAKSGAVKAAQLAGVPIVPMSGAVSRSKIFGSWDRFCLPAPFARGVVFLGDPITVPADADDDGIAAFSRRLEDDLNDLTAEADRHFGLALIEPADARA